MNSNCPWQDSNPFWLWSLIVFPPFSVLRSRLIALRFFTVSVTQLTLRSPDHPCNPLKMAVNVLYSVYHSPFPFILAGAATCQWPITISLTNNIWQKWSCISISRPWHWETGSSHLMFQTFGLAPWVTMWESTTILQRPHEEHLRLHGEGECPAEPTCSQHH